MPDTVDLKQLKASAERALSDLQTHDNAEGSLSAQVSLRNSVKTLLQNQAQLAEVIFQLKIDLTLTDAFGKPIFVGEDGSIS